MKTDSVEDTFALLLSLLLFWGLFRVFFCVWFFPPPQYVRLKNYVNDAKKDSVVGVESV